MRGDAKIVDKIRNQMIGGMVRITLHAHQEMAEDGIFYDDLYSAVLNGSIIEDYPEHKRGACCFLNFAPLC